MRAATPGSGTGNMGRMSTDIAAPAVDFGRKARQLIEEGYCVLEEMLDAGTLRHTREVAMTAVRGLSEDQLEATQSPQADQLE